MITSTLAAMILVTILFTALKERALHRGVLQRSGSLKVRGQ